MKIECPSTVFIFTSMCTVSSILPVKSSQVTAQNENYFNDRDVFKLIPR